MNNQRMRGGSESRDANTPENASGHCRISVTAIQERYGTVFPFTIAAPSFVLPAGVANNSRFLAEFFPEICLLFFESRGCLDYTDDDLPPDLADLPVSWHGHLPLDLPWQAGFDAAWQVMDALMDKAAYLAPKAWVLHPPEVPGMLPKLAERIAETGGDPAAILLENIHGHDLTAVWNEIRDSGFSVCLDLGHILAYGQQSVLELPGLWERVAMLHVYAPAPHGGKHCSLSRLDENGKAVLREMLRAFRGHTITLELFREDEIFQSLELLTHWFAQWEGGQ